MSNLTHIQNFLSDRKLIVAGASANPKKFGGQVFESLHRLGYELYPVNPNTKHIMGYQTYARLSDVPLKDQKLYIVTPKNQTDALIREAAHLGIREIWIQQTAETKESKALAESLGIQLISKKCLFMFLEPVEGVHKLHRGISKFFGTYPKEN